jgi:hypothetical protein
MGRFLSEMIELQWVYQFKEAKSKKNPVNVFYRKKDTSLESANLLYHIPKNQPPENFSTVYRFRGCLLHPALEFMEVSDPIALGLRVIMWEKDGEAQYRIIDILPLETDTDAVEFNESPYKVYEKQVPSCAKKLFGVNQSKK